MRQRIFFTWLVRAVALTSVAAFLCLSTGCFLAGLVADRAADPKVPAQYVPVKEPMLVLVENYRNPDSVAIVSDRTMSRLSEELRQHNVAPVIDSRRLFDFRTSQAEKYRRLKTPEIGRELGARQILYGNLIDFSIEGAAGSDAAKGHARIFIRIIDAQTGETRWPQDAGPGQVIDVETPTLRLGNGVTQNNVEDQLISRLSTDVARHFYTYSAEEVESAEERIQ